MRKPKPFIFSFMILAILSCLTLGAGATNADTTITLDQAVYFTSAEGSNVVLDAGDYKVESAEGWLQVTPSRGLPFDSLLLEAQMGSHEEFLSAPLAFSVQGETTDSHHLVVLLPGGKRLEAVGNYSGIRSRGTLPLLTIQHLKTLSSRIQSAAPPRLVYDGAVHKGSRGMNIVFPDVCKMPIPGGSIPIPLSSPNLTSVSDFDQGARKVKGGGNIRIMNKTFRTTKGNQEVYTLKLFDRSGRVIPLRQSRLIELEDGTYCAVCMINGRVTSVLKLQRMPQRH